MWTTISVVTLATFLVVPAAAQGASTTMIAKGTPVIVVGQVASQPRDFGIAREKKMQVAVGPEKVDHTLHLRNATMYDQYGREVAASDLLDKWWVRAEGRLMADPRRIEVDRLEVLGKDYLTYHQSAHFKPSMVMGYVVAENVAGVRQVLPSTRPFAKGERVRIVAPISSQPRDAGVAVEEKLQVSVGPEKTDYTLHLDGARVTGLGGAEVSAGDLRDKMWVQAEGTVMEDGRRIQVDRLEVIAGDEPGFRRSPFFRTAFESGYIFRMSDR